MDGDKPGLCDVHAYMNVWYVRQNLATADQMFAEFGNLRAWERRMRAIGHGSRSEMSTSDALELAAAATPQTAVAPDPGDPNGRKPGDRVEVMPDDYGKVKVGRRDRGALIAAHCHPPARSPRRRGGRAFSPRGISGVSGLRRRGVFTGGRSPNLDCRWPDVCRPIPSDMSLT